jgi:hypothetical protein
MPPARWRCIFGKHYFVTQQSPPDGVDRKRERTIEAPAINLTVIGMPVLAGRSNPINWNRKPLLNYQYTSNFATCSALQRGIVHIKRRWLHPLSTCRHACGYVWGFAMTYGCVIAGLPVKRSTCAAKSVISSSNSYHLFIHYYLANKTLSPLCS